MGTFKDKSAETSLEDDMLPPGDNDPKGDFAYRKQLESENEQLRLRNEALLEAIRILTRKPE